MEPLLNFSGRNQNILYLVSILFYASISIYFLCQHFSNTTIAKHQISILKFRTSNYLTPTGYEKTFIEEDLKKRKKRPGLFEDLGSDNWLLIPREPVTKWQSGELLVGEYVRLKAGTFCFYLFNYLFYFFGY